MKKIMNSPETLITDELQGFAKIYPDQVKLAESTTAVIRAVPKEKGKVKLVMGNGGGHEPAVIGWVGKGMFDCDTVGDLFSAPSGEKMYQAMEEINDGSPILMCVQNHAGDVINANIAWKKAKKNGINAVRALFYDDIASAPKEETEERRGIAGMLFYTKIVGALAEKGASIEECLSMFERVRDNTRTYAAAYSGCTHPGTGMKMFEYLEDNDLIEMGMGVHGEGGGDNRISMPKADKLAALFADILIEDRPYKSGEKVLVLVNGTGSSTMMELNILYNELDRYLTEKGLIVKGCRVGSFLTTQELAGVSVSLCAVDDEMLSLWKEPCDCPLWVSAGTRTDQKIANQQD